MSLTVAAAVAAVMGVTTDRARNWIRSSNRLGRQWGLWVGDDDPDYWREVEAQSLGLFFRATEQMRDGWDPTFYNMTRRSAIQSYLRAKYIGERYNIIGPGQHQDRKFQKIEDFYADLKRKIGYRDGEGTDFEDAYAKYLEDSGGSHRHQEEPPEAPVVPPAPPAAPPGGAGDWRNPYLRRGMVPPTQGPGDPSQLPSPPEGDAIEVKRYARNPNDYTTNSPYQPGQTRDELLAKFKASRLDALRLADSNVVLRTRGLQHAVEAEFLQWMKAGKNAGAWKDWLKKKWTPAMEREARKSGLYDEEKAEKDPDYSVRDRFDDPAYVTRGMPPFLRDFVSKITARSIYNRPDYDKLVTMYKDEFEKWYQKRRREEYTTLPGDDHWDDDLDISPEGKQRLHDAIEREKKEIGLREGDSKYDDEFAQWVLETLQESLNKDAEGGPSDEKMTNPEAKRALTPDEAAKKGQPTPTEPGKTPGAPVIPPSERSYLDRERPAEGETLAEYQLRMRDYPYARSSVTKRHTAPKPGETPEEWRARMDAWERRLQETTDRLPSRPPGLSDLQWRRAMWAWAQTHPPTTRRFDGESDKEYAERQRAYREADGPMPTSHFPIDDDHLPPHLSEEAEVIRDAAGGEPPAIRGDEKPGDVPPGSFPGVVRPREPPIDRMFPDDHPDDALARSRMSKAGEKSYSQESITPDAQQHVDLLPYVNKFPFGHSEYSHWGGLGGAPKRQRRF